MTDTRSATTAVRSPWLVPMSPQLDHLPRLFCVPYAGGGASVYREWARLADGRAAIWAVRPPGRESRIDEPPYEDAGALAAALAEVLLPLLRTGTPYALLGHSMGAVVCFELARQLAELDVPSPVRLFVSGRRGPATPDPNPIHQLPQDQFLNEVVSLGGIPREVLAEPGLMDLVAPTMRADYRVAETYRIPGRSRLDSPISAFGGLDDDTLTLADIEGWCDVTTAQCTVRMLPGDHFFLHSERSALVAHVLSDLAG